MFICSVMVSSGLLPRIITEFFSCFSNQASTSCASNVKCIIPPTSRRILDLERQNWQFLYNYYLTSLSMWPWVQQKAFKRTISFITGYNSSSPCLFSLKKKSWEHLFSERSRCAFYKITATEKKKKKKLKNTFRSDLWEREGTFREIKRGGNVCHTMKSRLMQTTKARSTLDQIYGLAM